MMTPNTAAFLSMLAHSEGTDRAADPYRVCYGFKHTIIDLNFHPAEHRPPDGAVEWKGEPLDDLGALYVGMHSSAAGRYQMRLRTFLDCKASLKLTRFDATAQDACAVLLLQQLGAFMDVFNGRINDAIFKCRNEWASLPGGSSHQPERTSLYLTNFYSASGGVLLS
jgi:lysozyme